MRLMTLLIAILWSASALSSQQTSDPIKLAEGFVGLLRDGKFDEANRMLSKVMVEGLEKQELTLRAIWTGLVAQLGR